MGDENKGQKENRSSRNELPEEYMWFEENRSGFKCRDKEKMWKTCKCGSKNRSGCIEVVWSCGKNGEWEKRQDLCS